MIYTLENDISILKVDTKACEIASFKRKDKSIEYMWDGDPKYWSGRNPILFPHVSSPSDKIINFKGEDFKVNNHGIARSSEFELVEKGYDFLNFELRDSEETLKQYPYRFILRVDYRLEGNTVHVGYQIINYAEEKLYFGFGLHPAFRCPLVSDKKFDDYCVLFDEDDVEGRKLDLSYGLFEKYPTYVIRDPKSRNIRLTDGDNGVVMHIDDRFHIFALWTPHAPFVCLEPWVNALDGSGHPVFEDIEDNICLLKDETYEIGYSFEIV